ncbi:phosphotransferase [Aliiroseovarius sp. S1339]|uniref:phosphotransferase n=1 Tax=Aliiroseovarius sp. S1339 TaxID=2936990 RepID=UPI0020BEAB37|nr:phosphotransferase [Aliiroseovarius sp. S1339]MCK8463347.1 phosphotransferase [Aliiroseovarius sp. S1339]
MDIMRTRSALDQLKRIWSDAGVIPDGARWAALAGGRTNPIWKVDLDAQTTLVCKLFTLNSATPLFANDGTREALALRALSGTQIAPELVAFQDSRLGESIVYKHISGAFWRGDVTMVAKLMARLHQHPLPEGLPHMTVTPASLIANGRAMAVAGQNGPPPPPAAPDLPPARRAFLHGDIVPGNILETRDGCRLIDWQCPAIGDPSADIAMFLSPAMQVLYGHRALSADEIEKFLLAYERESRDSISISRYRALAPLFQWRMATYCQWKSALGDHDYAHVVALEMAALEQA